MTVSGRPNGGDGAAVTRAPTNIRDGIQPHHGFRSVGWIVSCIGNGDSIRNLDS
jgi:hypothetical protein